MPNNPFLQLPSERRKRANMKTYMKEFKKHCKLKRAVSDGEIIKKLNLALDSIEEKFSKSVPPTPAPTPQPDPISCECNNQRKFPELLDDFRKLHARQVNDASTIRSAIAVKTVSRRPGCVREFRETVIEIQRSATELLKWCNRNMGTIGAKDREMRRMGIDPYKKNEEDEG